MVAAAPSAAAAAHKDPVRPPLIPADKDNAGAAAAVPRRPKTKQITSRYLSSSSSTSSSSTATTTSSSSSVGGATAARRYPSPSPLLTPRPSTPPTLHRPRSHSVGRARPDPQTPSAAPRAQSSTPAATTTTTRSLSVSFQGESFFYQTSKAKPSPTPRRPATPTRTAKPAPATPDYSHSHSRPFDRWPAARPRHSNPLARALDCSSDVSPGRASFDAGDISASSDTDSVSSGSNSGASVRAALPRGICVPAKFWQETNSRLRRLPEPGIPLLSPAAQKTKMALVKKLDSPVSSPRSSVSSPLRGPVRPSSPGRVLDGRTRGMASPLRTRSGGLVCASPSVDQKGNAPSIISFAAEVRRGKKGENRIEDAHMLRLLDNRYLQWRFVNARASSALMAQRKAVEKNIYNAWRTTSGMRDSVTIKRIKLQLLTQNLKLTSILKGQVTYLEEWSLVEREHSSSLSGATEALEASTLRLPVVGGSRADLQEVKDAVGSAVDVMQAMGSSICSLLSKVEVTSSSVSELARVAAQEQAMMDQSRELLSEVAAMHVKQCSLRGHILQLKRKPNQMQL